MQPTVITGLNDSTRCMQEEIFGKFYITVLGCSVSVDNNNLCYTGVSGNISLL